ncbi:unnamed protein product, partial [Durusdinium trenchii]
MLTGLMIQTRGMALAILDLLSQNPFRMLLASLSGMLFPLFFRRPGVCQVTGADVHDGEVVAQSATETSSTRLLAGPDMGDGEIVAPTTRTTFSTPSVAVAPVQKGGPPLEPLQAVSKKRPLAHSPEDVDDDGNPMPKAWRRGFWTGEPTWQGTGPQPGDINEVVRRHVAQKAVLPPGPISAHSEIDDLLSSAAMRLRKAAAKKKRQAKALRVSSSSDSSTSSSSSTS